MNFEPKRWINTLATLIVMSFVSSALHGAQVSLAWDPPTHNLDGSPIENLAGYKVYYGSTSSDYGTCLDVGNARAANISGLIEGAAYYFSAKTYNTEGLESPFSDEFAWTVPDVTPPEIVSAPDNMALQADEAGQAVLPDLTAQVAATDNCSGPGQITITQSPAPGTMLAMGAETIVFTASDAAGNQVSHSSTLTVTDEAFSTRRPVLSWDAVDGATWYCLWINRNGRKYVGKWLNQTSTTWISETDMPGGEYTWWVKAWGPETGGSAWSAESSFSIEVKAPGKALLHAPEGALETDRLDCSWEADEQATWYYVWVSRNGGAYKRKWVEGNTEYSTGAGLPYGNYKWWVRTWGPDGSGPWSDPKSCTYGATQPEAPSGTVDGSRLPQLFWTDVAEADSYQIWVSRNGRKYASVTVQDATWTPETEMPGGSYEWWVKIQGENGFGPWSSSMSFTIAAVKPGAVSNLSAAGTGESGVVEYSWQADEQATWYQLSISVDGKNWFSQWFETGHVADTVTIPVSGHSDGKTYEWWVRGWNVDGSGSWSAAATVAP